MIESTLLLIAAPVNSGVMLFPCEPWKETQMKRTPYILVLLLAIAIAFVGGVSLTQRLGSRAQEKTNDDENKILVHGYGTANSVEKPPGQQFTLIASNAPQRSFKVVPPGKTFIHASQLISFSAA
jgi:hypothetical protein